jgi:hypothetical protein
METQVWDNFVDVKCCGGICQFRRILPTKYFVSPNPPPLRISGGVMLSYMPTVNMIGQMRQFYEGTGGPKWYNQRGWTVGCPCEWLGVTCNPQKYIISIDLPNNGLTGPLPSILADMWTLEALAFPGNALTELPGVIGELPLTSLVRTE